MGVLVLLAGSCGVPLTAPDGALLQISASPLSIPSNGGASTVTVVATKAAEDGGGPVADGTQIFFTTPIGVIEERVSTQSGIARATLRSDGRSGDAAVVASSGGGASVTLNPPVTIGVSEATRIVLLAQPIVVSAPDFTSDIEATASDGSGNPLRNVPIVFSTSAGRLASAGSVLRTDARGRATDRLALGNERLARVSASSGAVVSNTVTVLRDDATGPIVSLVSPSSGSPGQTLNVAVSGSGFESGASVSFGGGTTGQILSVSPTEIRVSLTIADDAVPGPRDVTVTNPSGDTDTLTRGFTVGPQGPTVTAVEPAEGNPGQTVDATISGSNFRTGARVTFGDGITVNVNSVREDTIAVRLAINAGARLGSRDVTVTNPDGASATLPDGFTVESPPPEIDSVQPTFGTPGATVSATLTGANFQQDAEVSFGEGIRVTIGTITSTSIAVTLFLEATLGARDVTVTNPDGKSDTLEDAFTVQ